jgi:hypothetical protein
MIKSSGKRSTSWSHPWAPPGVRAEEEQKDSWLMLLSELGGAVAAAVARECTVQVRIT